MGEGYFRLASLPLRTLGFEAILQRLIRSPPSFLTSGLEVEMGQWLHHRPGYVGLTIALCMLAAMLGIAFERNLVGTLTQHGWGRTLQGAGAALTQLRCGVGGAVIDKRL